MKEQQNLNAGSTNKNKREDGKKRKKGVEVGKCPKREKREKKERREGEERERGYQV